MNEVLNFAETVLEEFGYFVERTGSGDVEGIAFESDSAIGFVIAYSDVSSLLHRWRSDSDALIARYQLALKRAAEKAWNAYVVLLADGSCTKLERVLLDNIEEDLVATRKIARAAVTSPTTAIRALLPLLPIQSEPRLEEVDLGEEIRIRSTEIPSSIVEAFLSEAAPNSVFQLMEEL